MSDPFSVFGAATDGKRELLKTVWPELYTSLARLDTPRPEVRCVSATHRLLKHDDRPPAVGRIVRNGAPACRRCIDSMSARPGGYPLQLTDPRNIK